MNEDCAAATNVDAALTNADFTDAAVTEEIKPKARSYNTKSRGPRGPYQKKRKTTEAAEQAAPTTTIQAQQIIQHAHQHQQQQMNIMALQQRQQLELQIMHQQQQQQQHAPIPVPAPATVTYEV